MLGRGGNQPLEVRVRPRMGVSCCCGAERFNLAGGGLVIGDAACRRIAGSAMAGWLGAQREAVSGSAAFASDAVMLLRLPTKLHAHEAWNTSVLSSMLSRGGASAGVVGSVKAV